MAKLAKEKKEKDLTKERLKSTIPLAEKVIEIIAKAKLPVGDVHASDNAKYSAVAKEVLEAALEHEMKYVDKDFLFQLVFQPFDQVRQIVINSLSNSFDKALEKTLDKEFRELTLKDIDRILKYE